MCVVQSSEGPKGWGYFGAPFLGAGASWLSN